MIQSNINTVLFDLDGTLVPMNDKSFVEAYFSELAKVAAPYGYDGKTIVSAVWAATEAMFKNDGTDTNFNRFWSVFRKLLGEKIMELKAPFDAFYENEFDSVRRVARPNPLAKPLIDFLRGKGYTIVIATNPVFPKTANVTRMGWVGLSEGDADLITSYEDSSFCKPTPGYYNEILTKIGKKPEACVMVGNDAREDMAAADLGMAAFLVTDHLINKDDRDVAGMPQGSFADAAAYLSYPG